MYIFISILSPSDHEVNHNFRFYTYGSFPLDQHLQHINEHVLNRFQPASAETSVPNEPRWQTPVIANNAIVVLVLKLHARNKSVKYAYCVSYWYSKWFEVVGWRHEGHLIVAFGWIVTVLDLGWTVTFLDLTSDQVCYPLNIGWCAVQSIWNIDPRIVKAFAITDNNILTEKNVSSNESVSQWWKQDQNGKTKIKTIRSRPKL